MSVLTFCPSHRPPPPAPHIRLLLSISAGTVPASRAAKGDLPESCVAVVLLRLDPPEICRMARLSHTFHGAASGDGVWESKLPRNYACLLAIAAAGDGEGRQADAGALEAEALPKKELYARLCRRNHFDVSLNYMDFIEPICETRLCCPKCDCSWLEWPEFEFLWGQRQEFWLDKSGGGVCMSISSRALSITGIDDRRYWNFICNPSIWDTSSFSTPIWVGKIGFRLLILFWTTVARKVQEK